MASAASSGCLRRGHPHWHWARYAPGPNLTSNAKNASTAHFVLGMWLLAFYFAVRVVLFDARRVTISGTEPLYAVLTSRMVLRRCSAMGGGVTLSGSLNVFVPDADAQINVNPRP
eukprot:67381-Rhodomonas_salina.2